MTNYLYSISKITVQEQRYIWLQKVEKHCSKNLRSQLFQDIWMIFQSNTQVRIKGLVGPRPGNTKRTGNCRLRMSTCENRSFFLKDKIFFS